MARIRTGYSCRDHRGRPFGAESRDIGPAAAGAVDGMAAVGRLSATRGQAFLQDDSAQSAGVGPIERRRATAEELARFDVVPAGARARPGPAIHLMRPAAASMAASRQRGAARAAQVYAARRPPVTTVEEEPVIPATPYAGIQIPCGSCLHEPVCYLKREIPANPNQLSEPMVMGPGLRLVTTGVRIECDHQLVSLKAVAPEPIRQEHGGESWRTVREASPEELVAAPAKRHQSKKGEAAAKAERAHRVLEALERNGGDRRAAAAELGMRPNALAMVLKHADRQAVPA